MVTHISPLVIWFTVGLGWTAFLLNSVGAEQVREDVFVDDDHLLNYSLVCLAILICAAIWPLSLYNVIVEDLE